MTGSGIEIDLRDPVEPNAIRVTAICEGCDKRVKGYVLGRQGDDPGDLLIALSRGWGLIHATHSQMVLASPARLLVEDLDD